MAGCAMLGLGSHRVAAIITSANTFLAYGQVQAQLRGVARGCSHLPKFRHWVYCKRNMR